MTNCLMCKMKDKEKTEEITHRIEVMTNGVVADNFIKIKEFRLGSGYDGYSQQRCDVFAISPNKGNKTICYEVKVSRSDFKNDIKKEDKQTAARCFANEFYYCTPKGLLNKDEVPVWAILLITESVPRVESVDLLHTQISDLYSYIAKTGRTRLNNKTLPQTHKNTPC